MIKFDEIINAEETKTIATNFNKTLNVYILLAFSLITIALLIAVSIFYYLMKYWAKRKHLLPFYNTNNELRGVLY